MAKKNPYVKIKSVEASARSWFGRPSEMDKTIERWVNKGWELKKQQKLPNKNRYLLTFEYRMSDEEIAVLKRNQRNGRIGCGLLFLCLIIASSVNSAWQERNEAATQTRIAQAHLTRVAVANTTKTKESLDATATATLWTPTLSSTPSDTPTNTFTPSPTFTPSITSTSTATFTASPTLTPTPLTYSINAANTINARKCPAQTCDVIAAFSPGETVAVSETVVGGEVSGSNLWLRIGYGDDAIYVHGSLAVPLVPSTPTRPVNTSHTTTYYVNSNGRVNIRACPSTDCAIVGTATRGDALRVATTVKVNDWYAVVMVDGNIGYVAAFLMSRNPPPTLAPPQPTRRPAQVQPTQESAPQVQPPEPAPDSGPTALCRDGTYSYSARRRGTCSHHGGVAQWLRDVPP